MIFDYDLNKYFNKSSYRFKGGGKMPSVPPPGPTPVANEMEVGDWAKKKAKRMSGYQKTILAGDLIPTSTGKKRTLG